MASISNDDHVDTSTPLSFYFFIGAVTVSVLGAIWMLIRIVFL